MTTRSIRTAAIVASLYLCSPAYGDKAQEDAAVEPPPPPTLEQEVIDRLAGVTRLSVRPVRITPFARQDDDVSMYLLDRVQSRFDSAGFELIDAERFSEIHDRINRDLGGIYDPMTGRLIDDRAESLKEYVEREYNETYAPQGELFVAVVHVGAAFSGNKARWHGVEQASSGKEGFWANFNTDGRGVMPALSLVVVVQDAAEERLFAAVGGIELASVLSANSLERIPPEELLNDMSRIDEALRLVFEAFDNSVEDVAAARQIPDSSPGSVASGEVVTSATGEEVAP